MSVVLYDAAELVKQYSGERGIVEGTACPKCTKLGIKNPIYYYRDINHKTGRGRCYSCAHVEGNKPTQKRQEVMQLPNGDCVYEGNKCRDCGNNLHIADEETGEKYGLTGKARVGKCYHCARLKSRAHEPVAAHRDFLNDVKKAVWKFMIRSAEAAEYVEVIARTPAEKGQIKQLFVTAGMMNRYAELADRPERYHVDHHVPTVGDGENIRGMTNIANLRIITDRENMSKRDSMPEKYQAEQVINIADFKKVIGYRTASAALKHWFAVGEEQDGTYTPERKAAYTKKQASLKAEIEAIESRLGESFCRDIYAAIDEQGNNLFEVLRKVQNKLKRYKTAGNQKLVETYKKRLALHGNRGFVKVEQPDLGAMAYIGKGAVLWAIEATVSNVVDGITLLMEKGMTPEEQRLVDAITYDCIGWALENMDSKGEVFPFVSPLLAVFGEKVFAVREKYGKHCLTVYTNDRKGQMQKFLDGELSASFDSRDWDDESPFSKVLISASDGDVLERMELFKNQTLALQCEQQAVTNAKEQAIGMLKNEAGRLLVEAGEALNRVNRDWFELVELAKQELCNTENEPEDNACILEFFANQWRQQFDNAKERQQSFMVLCREFIGVPFSEPEQAKEALCTLRNKQPQWSAPNPFTQHIEPQRSPEELERLRAIGERMERDDMDKAKKGKAEKQARAEKATFMRSSAGQQWLSNQKRQSRAELRELKPHGVSRDNRK